jgi:glutaredoxin
MSPITLDVLTSPGCHHCELMHELWNEIKDLWPNVTYHEVSLATPEGQKLLLTHRVLSSPGIIINGTLFSMGAVDRDALKEKLTELSHA